MARKLRIEFENAFYHVMARGNTRSRIFKSDSDRVKFLEYLSHITEKYGVIIHAYCLMNNHYHLFIETPNANLVKAMHTLNTSYSTYYNKVHDRTGHLFSGRYKALLVDKDSYGLILSAYIHLNPVRSNYIESDELETYKWSSFRFYSDRSDKYTKNIPIFIETSTILGMFGKISGLKNKEKYRKFVFSQLDENFNIFEDKELFVIGSDKFLQNLEKGINNGKVCSNLNIREQRKFFGTQDIQQAIIDIFSDEINIDISDSNKKKIMIYLLKKYTSLNLNEIAFEIGVSPSYISKTYKMVSETIENNAKFLKKVEYIENKLFKHKLIKSKYKDRPQC